MAELRETQACRLLTQGLLKRMETDPFEEITVTQICQPGRPITGTTGLRPRFWPATCGA